jgi:hypothetical protein
MCAKPQSQIGEASDDGACPGAAEAFSFARFVGVADALDAGEVCSLDVGDRVADECAFTWLSI